MTPCVDDAMMDARAPTTTTIVVRAGWVPFQQNKITPPLVSAAATNLTTEHVNFKMQILNLVLRRRLLHTLI